MVFIAYYVLVTTLAFSNSRSWLPYPAVTHNRNRLRDENAGLWKNSSYPISQLLLHLTAVAQHNSIIPAKCTLILDYRDLPVSSLRDLKIRTPDLPGMPNQPSPCPLLRPQYAIRAPARVLIASYRPATHDSIRPERFTGCLSWPYAVTVSDIHGTLHDLRIPWRVCAESMPVETV